MNYKVSRRGNMVEKIIDGAVIVTASILFWCQAVSAVSAPVEAERRANIVKPSPRALIPYWETHIAAMGVRPIAARREFTWASR